MDHAAGNRCSPVLFAYSLAWTPKNASANTQTRPCAPHTVWTDRISPGKQDHASIKRQFPFPGEVGASDAVSPIFNPHLLFSGSSIFVIFVPLTLPLQMSSTPYPTAPNSIIDLLLPQSTSQFLFFSILIHSSYPQEGKHSTGWTPPLLPRDGGFAQGLGWALCHRGRKELIRLLFVVAFCILLWEGNLTRILADVHTVSGSSWVARSARQLPAQKLCKNPPNSRKTSPNLNLW